MLRLVTYCTNGAFMRRTLNLRCLPHGAAALVACIAAASPGPAGAALIQVADRAALGADLRVDWGLFGPAGSVVNAPVEQAVPPISVVARSSYVLARADEGTDYLGDFTRGDRMLRDAGSQSDSFSLSFPTPIAGLATQIDPTAQLGAFTGSFLVFSSTFAPLGTFAFSGTADDLQDGSAPVIGVRSDAADIGRIEFRIDQSRDINGISPFSGAVAINALDVRTAGQVPIPEPAGAALLGLGLLGLAAVRRGRPG